MTEREMLKFAAKAAGIELLWTFGGIPVNTPTVFKGLSSDETWNPLIDDGDALRLMVKLGLGVSVPLGYKRTDVVAFSDSRINVSESHGSDPLAATRRAIVRAAAEIGRKMP
jgi:hypothetical protein